MTWRTSSGGEEVKSPLDVPVFQLAALPALGNAHAQIDQSMDHLVVVRFLAGTPI